MAGSGHVLGWRWDSFRLIYKCQCLIWENLFFVQIIFTNTVKSLVLNTSLVFLFQSVGTGELMAVDFNISPMFTLCLSRGMLAHISCNVPQSTVRWTWSGPQASQRARWKRGHAFITFSQGVRCGIIRRTWGRRRWCSPWCTRVLGGGWG